MELLSILHNTNVSIALQEGGEAAKAFCSVNFVLSEAPLDVETSVALTFLDYLLVGTDAAPLMKAINDSGLGESVVGGGTDDTLRQPTFSMGLKGVPPEDVEKVRLDHTPEAPVIHSPVNSTFSMVWHPLCAFKVIWCSVLTGHMAAKRPSSLGQLLRLTFSLAMDKSKHCFMELTPCLQPSVDCLVLHT
jgi:hypothetical protein